MLTDAQKRLFNFVRFCFYKEPYDTIILESRAYTEIDTLLGIFEVVSAGEIFKTDITKINEDFSGDEETCFAEWFKIKSVADVYKLILASIERNIL